MSPSGCGTLFAQTNVTAVCPNLCSANCNGGGDEPTSTSNVGMIAGIAASIFVLLACVGVAVVVSVTLSLLSSALPMVVLRVSLLLVFWLLKW